MRIYENKKTSDPDPISGGSFLDTDSLNARIIKGSINFGYFSESDFL